MGILTEGRIGHTYDLGRIYQIWMTMTHQRAYNSKAHSNKELLKTWSFPVNCESNSL